MARATPPPDRDDLERLERDSVRTARAAQRLAVVIAVIALGLFAALGTDRAPSAEASGEIAPAESPDGSPLGTEAPAPGATDDGAALTEPVSSSVASTRPGLDPPPGMVLVPAGPFVMGRADGGEDERPPHEVSLGPYFIDTTEVTVGAYLACVERGACRAPSPRCPGPGPDRPAHPVACVDWNQAQSYCAWAGKRLPTEAEWEKAARGTDQRPYPWGDEPPSCARASFNDRGEEPSAPRGCGRGVSWPVGSFQSGASPYGALDMAGNVWEWVEDRWAPDYYAESPRTDPTGPESGDMRVRRGGSWAHGSRPAKRDRRVPLREEPLSSAGGRAGAAAPAASATSP